MWWFHWHLLQMHHIHPDLKYQSPTKIITLLLSALLYKLLHLPTYLPTLYLKKYSCLVFLLHAQNTKSYAYKRLGNIFFFPSSRNLTPLLPISFTSLQTYTQWTAKETWYNLVSSHFQFWATHSQPDLWRQARLLLNSIQKCITYTLHCRDLPEQLCMNRTIHLFQIFEVSFYLFLLKCLHFFMI